MMRAFVLAFAFLLTVAGPAQAQGVPDLGARVDSFTTTMLRHAPPFRAEPSPYDLSEVLGKKTVVFYYWMPSYTGSVNELVELNKFARSLKGNNLTIITASRARNQDEINAVRGVIESKGITLPVILDDMSLMMRLGVTNVPRYVVVDKTKKIAINDVSGIEQKLKSGERLSKLVVAASKAGDVPVVKGAGDAAIFQLIGDPVPQFELADMQGKNVNTASYTGKKPYVLVFWSALCPHCQKELPKLKTYLEKNKGKFDILSVTRYSNDAHKTATVNFVKDKKIGFPVLVDEAGVNDRFAVTGLPTWVLVDAAGKVQHVEVGANPQLESILDRELAKAAKAK
jgi:peroxiredoxin